MGIEVGRARPSDAGDAGDAGRAVYEAVQAEAAGIPLRAAIALGEDLRGARSWSSVPADRRRMWARVAARLGGER